MKLISLETVNFKALGTRKVEFTDGMNFIVGDNGAGKSTLLRAIGVALYGTAVLPGVAKDITTIGKDDPWKIKLVVDFDGDVVEVFRDDRNAKVSRNGSLVANGKSACSEFLSKKIGYDLKDYNLLIHSRQGDTAALLGMGGIGLQRKVEQLSGVLELDAVCKAVREKHNNLKAMLAALEIQQEGMPSPAELDETIKSLQHDAEVARVNFIEAGKQLESMKPPEAPKKPNLRAARQAYLDFEKNYQLYLQKKQGFQDRIEELSGSLMTDEQRNEVTRQANELKALEGLDRTFQEAKRHIAALEEQTEQVTTKVNENMVEQAKKAVDGTQEVLNEAKTATGVLRETLRKLKKAEKESVCPTCGTTLNDCIEDLKKNVSKTVLAIEAAKNHESSMLEVRDKAEGTYHLLRSALAKVQKNRMINEQIEELKRVKPVDQESLSALRDEVLAKKACMIQDRTNRETLDRTQELMDRLSEPLQCVEVSEEAAVESEGVWARYDLERASFGEKKATAENQVSMYQRVLESANSSLKMYSERREQVTAIHTQIATVEHDHTTAGDLLKFLLDKRKDYLESAWASVYLTASTFLNAATDGWISSVEDKEGAVLYSQANGTFPVEEASGAQQAFLGVALRLGMSSITGERQAMMMFDEPTAALTEANSRALMAELGNYCEQCIIVTHRDTDQGLAQNLIAL